MGQFLFYFCEGATLIGPSPIFLERWALLNRSTTLDPSCKIETNARPFSPPFSVVHESSTLGKSLEKKLRCYWERLCELHGNMMRTHWENIGNKGKKLPQPHPQKEKIWPIKSASRAFPLAASNFYFKTICHHFWLGLMARHKMWEKCPIELPYSLDEVPPKFVFFFLGQQTNLIGPSLKKKRNLAAPQNVGFYFEV